MSSNLFQFTQIWHFCNGLNQNKAQMSLVWGWNRQMRKKRDREVIVLNCSWDLWKMTLPLAYHLEFSVFFAKWYATLSGLSVSMFFVQLQRSHMVEATRKLLYDNNKNQLSACLQFWFRVFFFCKIFFSFLELFLVTLLHGKGFFLPLKKGEIFKENQQLKGTMENSPEWLKSFYNSGRIFLFHTSCISGLFKLFPNNQTDDKTGLARTAVPCGQFKLV